MADPIVCDCGGSTRLKRIDGGIGDMPGLLDVKVLASCVGGADREKCEVLERLLRQYPKATGSQETIPSGGQPFVNMKILFQDANGTPFTIPVGLPNSCFLIESGSGQKVRGDFIPTSGNLVITVFSTIPGVDPLVEAKQFRVNSTNGHGNNTGQRRYIVVNAGPIQKISLDGVTVYDSTNITAAPRTNPTAVGLNGAVLAPGLPLYVSVLVS
jgi:hypothetical protein